MYRRIFYDRIPSSHNSRRLLAGYHNDFNIPDPYSYTYGPSRSTTYPWDRDHAWRRRRNESSGTDSTGDTEATITAENTTSLGSANKPPVGDSSKPEVTNTPTVDIKTHFHVVQVDVNIAENTKAHHTYKYECTKRKFNPCLVIRRGQSFVMTVTFSTEYDAKNQDVHFSFYTGKNPSPPKKTSVYLTMNESTTSTATPDEWFVKLFSIRDKSINVEITPACNCIIGEWMFTIYTEEKKAVGGESMKLEYKYNEDIIILLNPWCTDDQVHMQTEGLLDEYVLNESGAIYGGTYTQIGAKPWNFGQFEDPILDICLHIVRKAFNNTVDPGMADSVKLARAISQIVNAQDDGGVMVGNWSGKYEGGTSPSVWVGSESILREYAQNQGNPVKFGQCWVFSGIATTVCRAIGLPVRSVSNFNSAHDKDGSTSIDFLFVRQNGILKPLRKTDSVWNFHVWNEVWMTRKSDLGKGYDGWQVIDSTPQEVSDGQYRCGPTPVNAIKKGDIGKVLYDAPFVFAEVNADIVNWEIKPNNKWEVLRTNTSHVGKNISTKKPDGQPYRGDLSLMRDYAENYREDITHEYKHAEGTLEERFAVDTANKTAKAPRNVFKITEPDIAIQITDKDGILVGQDFDVDIKVKNIAQSRENRTITKLIVKIDSVKYTGEEVDHIALKMYENFSLNVEEEKSIKITVTTKDYLDHLFELYTMNILAVAHIKETNNVHVEKEDYRLRRPDISVTGPQQYAKIGEHYEIQMTFTNPLPVALTKCSILIEGNGVKNIARKEKDVPAKSEWKSTAILEPRSTANIQVNVSFDSHQLKDITGFIVISVQS